MIGDVLTSSVLFEVLRKEYPKAELHYLINTHTQAVIIGNPNIDNLVFFSPEMEQRKLVFLKLLRQIKKEKYDAVIDVYGKLSSKLISKFSHAKTRIAYAKKNNGFFYTHSIQRITKPANHSSLAIENRLRLLQPLNISFQQVAPKIYLTKPEIEQAAAFLKNAGISKEKPVFMISVLGSNEAKTYPAGYMAKLLDEIVIVAPDAQILFNYIPNQEKDARAIYELTSASTQEQIFFEVFGKSLREFLAITSHCKALIGNEGGAINMAKALEIPTFIIFSPHMNKANWFGDEETKTNVAVHLSDFITHEKEDRKLAKANPETYYLKFKPTFIAPLLNEFLRAL